MLRASSRANPIKTHHNDSEMVRQLRLHGRVVEPIKELFVESDFGETQVLIRLMVDYANIAAKEHALLNRIEIVTSEEERILLEEPSSRNQCVATLLPIRTAGVQGDCRSYSYCVALSSDQTQPNWKVLL
ncbi:GMP synthase [Daphnia magna]|uniref:GMP synthase n=1 Tax=Daphnia magna TaxID=35525 RepID=A0A162NBY1_9CRUS|nr:GMP synthase [Daphnia magna]